MSQSQRLSPVKLGYIKKYLHGAVVLDLGAGDGRYSRWITQRDANCRVHAVDLLQIKAQERVHTMQCDLEQGLPDSINEISTILAFDIIEHVTNVTQLLDQLYDRMQDGGVLIGSVPHDDDQFLPNYNLTFKHRKDLTHVRYYTLASLQAALEGAGFAQVQIFHEGGVAPAVIAEFFPKSMHWPVKKCIGLLRRAGLINTSKLSSDLFFVARKSGA